MPEQDILRAIAGLGSKLGASTLKLVEQRGSFQQLYVIVANSQKLIEELTMQEIHTATTRSLSRRPRRRTT